MLWLLSALVACDGGSDTGNDCTDLTWDNYGQGYVRSWCAGCHSSALSGDEREGATVGVDFDSHAGVLDHVDRIIDRGTGDAPTMPPVGGSSEDERERVLEWLECGAP